jgi:hypothetical protein
MLFSDVAHWHLFAFMVDDCDTEDTLAQENPLGVVSKRAMSKVWEEGLGFIEPFVDWQVILDVAAKFSSAVLCVLQGVSHGYTS